MKTYGRDDVRRLVALVLGLAIGLRAIQVVQQYTLSDNVLNPSGGMVIGFAVTVCLVLGLAIWRRVASPSGTAWPRLAALGVGMLLGGVIGWALFAAAHVSPWLVWLADLTCSCHEAIS